MRLQDASSNTSIDGWVGRKVALINLSIGNLKSENLMKIINYVVACTLSLSIGAFIVPAWGATNPNTLEACGYTWWMSSASSICSTQPNIYTCDSKCCVSVNCPSGGPWWSPPVANVFTYSVGDQIVNCNGWLQVGNNCGLGKTKS